MESSLSDIAAGRNTVHTNVFKAVEEDFGTIDIIISKIVQEAERNCVIAAIVVDPPPIAKEIYYTLQLTLSCREKIENLQLATYRNQKIQSFIVIWKQLQNKFEQFVNSLPVDHSLCAAMKTMNTAATSLLFYHRDQAGAQSSSIPSSDKDQAKRESVMAFMDLPDKNVDVVHRFARRSLPKLEVQSFIDQLFEFWNIWHVSENNFDFQVGKGGIPVKLGIGGFSIVYAGKLTTSSKQDERSIISVAIKEIS